MKQIISVNKTKTIDILDFEPTFTDKYHEEFIKPIGILDNRENSGEKSFFIQSEFGGCKVDHVSVQALERGNSYSRGIKTSQLKDYIKRRVEYDYLEVYVFEDTKELLKWLAE